MSAVYTSGMKNLDRVPLCRVNSGTEDTNSLQLKLATNVGVNQLMIKVERMEKMTRAGQ